MYGRRAGYMTFVIVSLQRLPSLGLNTQPCSAVVPESPGERRLRLAQATNCIRMPRGVQTVIWLLVIGRGMHALHSVC